MHVQYYGFTGQPFPTDPDPNSYFESSTHRKAMSYLSYALAQGEGLICITGEAGTGKTTLMRHMLSHQDVDQYLTAEISAAEADDNLLALIATQFGLSDHYDALDQWMLAIAHHLESEAAIGRRALLCVDDAQKLSPVACEILSQLAILSLDGTAMVQIFLAGQAETYQNLLQYPALANVRQQMIAAHQLEPMEAQELEPYIFHLLAKAGWKSVPSFASEVFDLLYLESKAIPAHVNIVMDNLLSHAASHHISRICGECFEAMIVAQQMALVEFDDRNISETQSRNFEDTQTENGQENSEVADEEDMKEEISALQDRIAKLELRLTEQDAALRRVIDLLIQWVDPAEKPEIMDMAEKEEELKEDRLSKIRAV